MTSTLDIIGRACLDYLHRPDEDLQIEVWSNLVQTDYIPVSHFFRSYEDMPELEQTALRHARGRVLDMGAGAGSHALWLQQQGLEVWAAEISSGACEVMKQRGVKNIIQQDIFEQPGTRNYDTLLMMMNGIGMAGTLQRLRKFFSIAKKLLAPGGQILVDSSDLRYLFLQDDGSILINLNSRYYGEVEYRMAYAGQKGRRFPWLFIDDQLLAHHAEKNGFQFEKLQEGEHYDYLARMTTQ